MALSYCYVDVIDEEAGDVYRGGRAYDVQVWSPPETRQSVSDLRNLLIDTPDGGHVRLTDVAEVRVAPVPNVIHHFDLFRSYMSIYAREQAYCHFSPALIANLERHWNAHNRKP